MNTAGEKAEARKAAFRRRRAADQGVAALANRHLTEVVQSRAGPCVSGYWPIRTEIDPRPTLQALLPNRTLCLPVVQGPGQALAFRRWTEDTQMIEGAFGAAIPEPDDEITPDILIVPMAAFDPSGYRLGYGGGFYDRTLENLRKTRKITAIGFAYDIQKVDRVPREATDQALDLIVTESGIRTPD